MTNSLQTSVHHPQSTNSNMKHFQIFKDIFSHFYMHSDMLSSLKSLNIKTYQMEGVKTVR